MRSDRPLLPPPAAPKPPTHGQRPQSKLAAVASQVAAAVDEAKLVASAGTGSHPLMTLQSADHHLTNITWDLSLASASGRGMDSAVDSAFQAAEDAVAAARASLRTSSFDGASQVMLQDLLALQQSVDAYAQQQQQGAPQFHQTPSGLAPHARKERGIIGDVVGGVGDVMRTERLGLPTWAWVAGLAGAFLITRRK